MAGSGHIFGYKPNDKTIDAGAPEIEITPEMIEAGVRGDTGLLNILLRWIGNSFGRFSWRCSIDERMLLHIANKVAKVIGNRIDSCSELQYLI